MTNVVLSDGPTGPAQGIVAITLANTPIPTTKAVNCGSAGTLNGIDEYGNVFTAYPLQQGYNPIRITQASLGGTATNLWALY